MGGAGAGILISEGASPTLASIILEANYAAAGGVALHAIGPTTLAYSRLFIWLNRGEPGTCALRVGPRSTGRLEWSTIANNQTDGICIDDGSDLKIHRSIIAHNQPGIPKKGPADTLPGEVTIALLVLVLTSLGVAIQIYVRNARRLEHPIARIHESAALWSQLVNAPVATLAPLMLASGVVAAGFWISGSLIRAWAGSAILAVTALTVTAWVMSKLAKFRQEFDALVSRVFEEPSEEAGLAVLQYMRTDVPGVYKERAARLVGDIEETTPRLLESVWRLAEWDGFPESARDELWKSAQQLENMYWREHSTRKGVSR